MFIELKPLLEYVKINEPITFNTSVDEISRAYNKKIEGRRNLIELSWENKNPNMIIEYSDNDNTLFYTREQSNLSYLNSNLRTSITGIL